MVSLNPIALAMKDIPLLHVYIILLCIIIKTRVITSIYGSAVMYV